MDVVVIHNGTWFSEFILIGITDRKELKFPLLILFLAIYLITVFGNTGIITAIRFSSPLHRPMYFLLGNLSFLDLFYSSTICPRTLTDFLRERKVISVFGCALQQCLLAGLLSVEFFLLAAMSFDRYAAVCEPLHYATIMSKRVCVHMVAGSYCIGFLESIPFTVYTFEMPFCKNVVHHFYCDTPPLLKLSCVSTFYHEALLFVMACLTLTSTILAVVISYTKIFLAILRINSTTGRLRVFSTCSSHFFCVTLLYGTVFFMYFRPSSSYSLDQDKVVSIFYTLIIPMLNPFIYSLRNKEMKEALKKLFRRKRFF